MCSGYYIGNCSGGFIKIRNWLGRNGQCSREGQQWGSFMRELKHVLVVEDDDVMRKSLEIMLRKHYDVHCEKYGKMAIAYAKCQRVDLILLDINMPFLNGINTLEKLRQLSDYELCPVVVLTGQKSREMKKRCFALGAEQFLTKPVAMEKLIETLDCILYERSGRGNFSENKPQKGEEISQNFVPIAESVLLIGEDRQFLETMRSYLQGYLPRLAVGKEEALLYLDKLRPAVIYVEDTLAGASDFNLIRKMRMQPYTWEIPFILFSRREKPEYDAERYMQEGIDFILQNPTREEVLETLKEALS